MSYDMLGGSSIASLRAGCDPFDLPSNTPNGLNNNYNNPNNYGNNGNNGMNNFPFKPLLSYTPSPRPHLSMAEQAELEFELRYRGNMIVDQQRKIQQLEEELKRARDQMDMMNSQISSYEQERIKERKKPQSRYWTPDEHQRFLEALTKYGHKDVKAISMHVSTRNATQVRTHAQKYFLRLERERRKKGDEDGVNREHDGYNSSGDEMYNSDQSMSPTEELSPPTGISTPPQSSSLPISILSQNNPPRRRRSTSLITPSLGKFAAQHKDAVLAELLSWTSEDFDQFVKGLLSLIEKQEDQTQACRAIRESYLPHLSLDDVESCYRVLNKHLKSKPAPIPALSSPKRRRTSKPELPINMPMINNGNNNEGPLPAMGSMPSLNNNAFGSFSGMSNMGGALPPPQYMNNNNINNTSNNSSVTLLPFQPPLGGLMNMNMSAGMRPILDYNGMPSGPSMAPLQMGNMNLGMSSLGMGMSMMDVSSNMPSSSSQAQGGWNSLAFSFDLHQNPSSSLSLPQGAPLVSSHN